MCSVQALRCNGWELTLSCMQALEGFDPAEDYPEYSADFYDGQHYVLRGSSPYTPVSAIRDDFRNFYQAVYPYHFAKFRCCSDWFFLKFQRRSYSGYGIICSRFLLAMQLIFAVLTSSISAFSFIPGTNSLCKYAKHQHPWLVSCHRVIAKSKIWRHDLSLWQLASHPMCHILMASQFIQSYQALQSAALATLCYYANFSPGTCSKESREFGDVNWSSRTCVHSVMSKEWLRFNGRLSRWCFVFSHTILCE